MYWHADIMTPESGHFQNFNDHYYKLRTGNKQINIHIPLIITNQQIISASWNLHPTGDHPLLCNIPHATTKLSNPLIKIRQFLPANKISFPLACQSNPKPEFLLGDSDHASFPQICQLRPLLYCALKTVVARLDTCLIFLDFGFVFRRGRA